MMNMNVTAKHGYGAVHLGGRELSNGRWTPACGTQHHNTGGREVTPLRPTDAEVTCKRCLKHLTTAPVVPEPRMQPKARKSTALGRRLASDHGLNFF